MKINILGRRELAAVGILKAGYSGYFSFGKPLTHFIVQFRHNKV